MDFLNFFLNYLDVLLFFFNPHKQVKGFANSADEAVASVKEAQTWLQKMWPDANAKLGKFSDSAVQNLQEFDKLAENVCVVLEQNSKLINEQVWPAVKEKWSELSNATLKNLWRHIDCTGADLELNSKLVDEGAWHEEKLRLFSELVGVVKLLAELVRVVELLTDIFAVALMLLGALLCRLIISSIQSREYTGCPSLQKSTFHAFYISCILLALYFTLEVLFELEVLDRQEEYPIFWLFLGIIPLLETVFCVIRGFFSLLWAAVSRFSERLTFAVLCATIALGVAVYVGMMGSEDMEVSE